MASDSFRDHRRCVRSGILSARPRSSSPADIPVALAASIPNAELFIAETEGHGGLTLPADATIADRLAE